MEEKQWHGWERAYGPRMAQPSLHVGPLPRRKSICLYEQKGGAIRVLATLDEASALRLVELMDYLLLGHSQKEPTP